MGFGSFRNAWFEATVFKGRSSAQDSWVEDHEITVQQLSDALTHLEYAYNVLAVVEISHSYPVDLVEAAWKPRPPGARQVREENEFIVGLMPQAAYMLVWSVKSGSLHIHVSGLSKVIEVLLGVFDPIRWRERSEDLRHKRETHHTAERRAEEEVRHGEAVHQLEEEAEADRLILQKLKTVRELSDFLEERLDPYLGSLARSQEDVIRFTYQELGRALRSLDERNIVLKSSQRPDDEEGSLLG